MLYPVLFNAGFSTLTDVTGLCVSKTRAPVLSHLFHWVNEGSVGIGSPHVHAEAVCKALVCFERAVCVRQMWPRATQRDGGLISLTLHLSAIRHLLISLHVTQMWDRGQVQMHFWAFNYWMETTNTFFCSPVSPSWQMFELRLNKTLTITFFFRL